MKNPSAHLVSKMNETLSVEYLRIIVVEIFFRIEFFAFGVFTFPKIEKFINCHPHN